MALSADPLDTPALYQQAEKLINEQSQLRADVELLRQDLLTEFEKLREHTDQSEKRLHRELQNMGQTLWSSNGKGSSDGAAKQQLAETQADTNGWTIQGDEAGDPAVSKRATVSFNCQEDEVPMPMREASIEATPSLGNARDRMLLRRSSTKEVFPTSFDARPCWQHEHANFLPKADKSRSNVAEETLGHGSEGSIEKASYWFVLTPHSPKRLVWDILGMILLLYDTVMIPMGCFKPEPTLFLIFMDYFTLAYWSLDVGASLITGYVAGGLVVMDLGRIRRNYIRTWLILDCAVTGPEWVFILVDAVAGSSGNNSDGAQISGLARILRAVRFVRLLRLGKLQKLFFIFADHINSEIVFVISDIFKLLAVLLSMNHFCGAIWYAVGDLTRSHGLPNWIDRYEYEEAALGDRYTVALHWSLCQFTPAPNHVAPQNVYERSLVIVVVVMGMVCFSSFVGTLTASVEQLRRMASGELRRFWLLRRYLKQHQVPAQLRYRILRYAEFASRGRKNQIQEQSIELLPMLSVQLQDELKSTVYFSCMLTHPLFDKIINFSRHMARGCTMAMQDTAFASGDVLFNPRVKGTHMYVGKSGEVLYNSTLSDETTPVHDRDWLCEQCLWTSAWIHTGQAIAASDCHLILVEASKFEDVTAHSDAIVHAAVSAYAHIFIKWLNTLAQANQNIAEVFIREEIHSMINDFTQQAWGGEASEKSEDGASTCSGQSRSGEQCTAGVAALTTL